MAELAKSTDYQIIIPSKVPNNNINIRGSSRVLSDGSTEFRDTSGTLVVTYPKNGASGIFNKNYQVTDINNQVYTITAGQEQSIDSVRSSSILTNGRDALLNIVDPSTGLNYTESKYSSITGNNLRPVTSPVNVTAITPSSVSVGNLKAREKYSSIKYPEKADPDQDYIQFTLLKYKPINLSTNITNTKRSNKNIGATITLPIQSGITDSNTAQWGEDRLNPVETAAALTAFNTMKSDDPEDFARNLTFGFKRAAEVFRNDPNTLNAIKAYFAGQAVGNQNLLSRINGAVLNPNLELLFQGPQLRNFNFNFQLTPRTDTETEKVRKIIRTFKQAMSVQRTAAELFLSTPNIFKIRYIFAPSNNDHRYLPRFKDCALTNFSVDYTPDGNYMTYADGSMTSYRLIMQFQELQPIYNDDYTALDKDTDDYIGY